MSLRSEVGVLSWSPDYRTRAATRSRLQRNRATTNAGLDRHRVAGLASRPVARPTPGPGLRRQCPESESVEECEDRVGRLVSAGRGADRGGGVRSPAFESVVGVQVDLGRCGALVSQPQRDREDVDVSDAQEHRDTGTKRGQCAVANGASPRCPRWQRPARTCDGLRDKSAGGTGGAASTAMAAAGRGNQIPICAW